MVASYGYFNKFHGKESVGFCLNTEERFLEVVFQNQQKDRRFL